MVSPVCGEKKMVDADGDAEPCWSGVTVTSSRCNTETVSRITIYL